MKKLGLVVSAVVIVGFIYGCGIKEDKAAAEAVAAGYFESVKAADTEKTLTFYSPRFFQETSREDWESVMKNLQGKLGDLESYELTTWNFRKQATVSGSGTYWVLQYDVKYSKYPATETLTIFKPIGGQYKIVGHNINSMALLME